MVVKRKRYEIFFRDLQILRTICDRVIFPNVNFTGNFMTVFLFEHIILSTMFRFQDFDGKLCGNSPDEYIRCNLKSSNFGRREPACKLIKALSQHFFSDMTEICGRYMRALLTEYLTSPVQNWHAKATVLYILSSITAYICAQKEFTDCPELNFLPAFYEAQIFPELCELDVNSVPVLKIEAIKFVMEFRRQLRHEFLIQCIPHLTRLMNSSCLAVSHIACQGLGLLV